MSEQFPELPYAGTSGHSGGETSKARALRDDKDGSTSMRQIHTVNRLRAVGSSGQTWKELASRYGWHHGQASGVLSVLHKTGHVARLTEKRQRCFVYVLPEYVDGRETQEQGRKAKAGFVVTDEFRAKVERDFAGLMREHLGPGYVSDLYRNEAEPFVAACLYYVNLALRGEA